MKSQILVDLGLVKIWKFYFLHVKTKMKLCGSNMWQKYNRIPKFPTSSLSNLQPNLAMVKKKIEKQKTCLSIVNNYIFVYELVQVKCGQL